MSDNEQEWKPNPRRPQSTMAQAFSLALDSAFSLDNEVSDLTLSIEQKKQMMTIQERELQALQEKIREAEARLNNRGSRAIAPTTLAARGGRPDQEDSSTSDATSQDEEGSGSDAEHEEKQKK